MPKTIDLTGKKFSRLTVVKRAGNKKGRVIWECLCSCGSTCHSTTTSLNNGNKKSCGCYHTEVMRVCNKTHGKTKTAEYNSWVSMKGRCKNKNNTHYHNYGGRGIEVCKRWDDSFENFISDMGLKPTKDHSVDRIDSNGNYSPENCKWSTYKEQNNNTKNNRLMEFNGETKTLAQWAECLNINKGTISTRLNVMGYSVERALTESIRKKQTLTLDGETKTYREWCEIKNIKYGTLWGRIKCGWSVKDALTGKLK